MTACVAKYAVLSEADFVARVRPRGSTACRLWRASPSRLALSGRGRQGGSRPSNGRSRGGPDTCSTGRYPGRRRIRGARRPVETRFRADFRRRAARRAVGPFRLDRRCRPEPLLSVRASCVAGHCAKAGASGRTARCRHRCPGSGDMVAAKMQDGEDAVRCSARQGQRHLRRRASITSPGRSIATPGREIADQALAAALAAAGRDQPAAAAPPSGAVR